MHYRKNIPLVGMKIYAVDRYLKCQMIDDKYVDQCTLEKYITKEAGTKIYIHNQSLMEVSND